jgi:hypothetical protein
MDFLSPEVMKRPASVLTGSPGKNLNSPLGKHSQNGLKQESTIELPDVGVKLMVCYMAMDQYL